MVVRLRAPARWSRPPEYRPAARLPDWLADAACAEPSIRTEVFFSESPEVQQMAVEVCAGCAVLQQCRESAIEERFGVWGGTVPAERVRMRRRRQRIARQTRRSAA